MSLSRHLWFQGSSLQRCSSSISLCGFRLQAQRCLSAPSSLLSRFGFLYNFHSFTSEVGLGSSVWERTSSLSERTSCLVKSLLTVGISKVDSACFSLDSCLSWSFSSS